MREWMLASSMGACSLSVPPAGEAANPERGAQRPPIAQLEAWEALGYGMCLHFGISTFDGEEWSGGKTPAAAYDPDRLDVDPGNPGTRNFATPFFVEYGKDGKDARQGADRYVYATSNDGAWNDGNWMTLGRVARNRIAALDASDWEFVHGFSDKREPIWKPGHQDALYTFWAPGRASMSGIHYVKPLDRYILPQWFYTHLDHPTRTFDATRWEFYESPTPWGPWTLFHSHDFEPEGWYNPCIPSKFISPDGKNLWLFTAGNFIRKELGLYGLWMIPMTLELV